MAFGAGSMSAVAPKAKPKANAKSAVIKQQEKSAAKSAAKAKAKVLAQPALSFSKKSQAEPKQGATPKGRTPRVSRSK